MKDFALLYTRFYVDSQNMLNFNQGKGKKDEISVQPKKQAK
jgi:hypothetical protein